MTPKTSLGFEVVRFAEEFLDIELLPWQQWLFIHGLELKPDNSYRFRTILVLVARQNGKTTALNILALWRLIMDGAQVVLGTSTNLEYAFKSWETTVQMAKASPLISDEFKWPETRKNGREALVTKDGAYYTVATASRTGGRSLAVDLLILDEIREQRTWAAWSASSKTTNARPRGQRWAISNMGDDTSVVLNHLQEKAQGVLSGDVDDPSLAIFEWSAPPGCDTADRSVWPMANPALGHTILEETLASDHTTDEEPVFRTEVLCQRVATLEPLPITVAMWQSRIDAGSSISKAGKVVLSGEIALDRLHASVGVAGYRDDGAAHVGLVSWDSGADWLLGRLIELAEKHELHRVNRGPQGKPKWHPAVVLDPMSPAGDLVEPLLRYRSKKFPQGINPVLMTSREVATATGGMQDAVTDGQVWHQGQPAVEIALAGAVKRDLGDGGWAFGRRKSAAASVDITPMVAVTNARWGLSVAKRTANLLDSVL